MNVPAAIFSVPPDVLEHALLGRDLRLAPRFECWKALATNVSFAAAGG